MSAHDAPAAEEPRTPVWLTVLGACLLLALAIWWVSPRPRVLPDATIRVPAPAAAPAAAPAPSPTAARRGGAPE